MLAAYDDSPNERLAEITRALVRHIHEFVAEVELTREEWFAGIDALTRTGHLFSNGRHNWRPAHLHLVVSAPGFWSVITHLFASESAYLHSDAVFGVRESLIVDMRSGSCEYDLVLAPALSPGHGQESGV